MRLTMEVRVTTSENNRVVHSWVDNAWDQATSPRSLPAVRLWGDVILELVAEAEDMRLDPRISIRRTSVFAWPTAVPPERAAKFTAEKRRVELTIDPGLCAVARIDPVDELIDPVSWARLRDWLV